MKRLMLGLLACAAAMPALASPTTVTYTGTVTHGTSDGTFGAAGTDLTGLNFTAAFVFETGTPGAARTVTPTESFLGGGPFTGTVNPLESADIWISSFSASVLYPQSGLTKYSEVAGSISALSVGTSWTAVDRYVFFYADGMHRPYVPGFSESFDYDTSKILGHSGQLHGPTGTINFDVQHLSVIGASVPEPASWALMLAGFAAVGSALRRQKVRVSFA